MGMLTRTYGAIAQLGEHLLCKQGVVGSIPTGSTSLSEERMCSAHKRLLKRYGVEAGIVFFEKVNE
jgi:hypothetical protein